MTAPTPKTPKTPPASVADQWREVQEAQRKRDRVLAELNTAIARYGSAETELGLATDRFDRLMAREPAPAVLKP
jgi:hypothetical protein